MNSSQLSPLVLPRSYNAATHFIDRHLDEGRASKIAVIDEQGSYTYAQLAERVNRVAGALLQLGLEPEQRVLLCLLDTIDFPTVFWGAIKAGLVPVPVNTERVRETKGHHSIVTMGELGSTVERNLCLVSVPQIAF